MDELSFWSCVLVVIGCIRLFDILISKLIQTRRYRSFYEKQGIRGPPFRFVVGNIPEIKQLHKSVPRVAATFNTASKYRVTPELCHFAKTYGNVSVHELGSTTRILMADAQLAKLVFVTKASCYTKADVSREALKPLIGNGVVFSEGEFWKQQRRILNPAFKLAYLKGLVKHMLSSCEVLTGKWSSRIEKKGFETIDVYPEMASLTLDVITRASFGSTIGGAKAGYVAFQCLDRLLSSSLQSISSYKSLVPGHTWLPTPGNLRLRTNERYVNKLLGNIIHTRWREKRTLACEGSEHDLLDMMLEAVEKKSPTMTMNQLLDECKTIFFAGHSTTALTLSWTLVMLSIHPHWQERARNEIIATFGNSDLDRNMSFISSEALESLEVVGWVINEALRLFPPVSSLSRQCQQAHKIGEYTILPGTIVMIPVLMILQSADLWGEDVSEFKPERFKNKKAKELPAFMVFGAGPRMCLGMNFALIEAKVLLSSLLRRFSFHLSPDYQHAPGTPMVPKPAFGAPLIVSKLN